MKNMTNNRRACTLSKYIQTIQLPIDMSLAHVCIVGENTFGCFPCTILRV